MFCNCKKRLSECWRLELRGRGWRVILPPCWFSLNNSETVKGATLAFCSIQLHLIRNVRAKFGISYSSHSPDNGQKSDGGISDFRISGQSLIKRNCHNSWTSNNIGMKLGPATKLDKRNKKTSKKIDDDVILENCEFIAIFSICGQFGAIWKPDSGWIVRKTYISINSNLLSYKNWKQS